MSETTKFECSQCYEETTERLPVKLVRSIGNLLVCPSCDVFYIEDEHVNDPIGQRLRYLQNRDLGDEGKLTNL